MDILSRLLDAVAVHLEIPRETLNAVEYQKRLDEGKDRHYIAGVEAMEFQRRSAAVFKAVREGVSTASIAERLGLSQRRVQQIISQRNAMP